MRDRTYLRKLIDGRGVHRLDEGRLNRLFDSLPPDVSRSLLRRKLPKLDEKRIKLKSTTKVLPGVLRNIVRSLDLRGVKDCEKRAYLFLGYCRLRNYTYNTVKRYFKILCQNGVFTSGIPEIDTKFNVTPDPTAFIGRLYTRVMSEENFLKLYEYLVKNWSEDTAPLVLAFHTGLRTMELLQVDAYVLYQLKNRHKYVNVKRKRTVATSSSSIFWEPVYNTHLAYLIDRLVELYDATYTAYVEHSINDTLFKVKAGTLVNRIRVAYVRAIGQNPPPGFGIHSCRSELASMLANETSNLSAIQAFLQHARISTTTNYVKKDLEKARKAFDSATQGVFSRVHDILERYDDAESSKDTDEENEK